MQNHSSVEPIKSSDDLDSFHEELLEAGGHVIVELRREFRRELELLASQSREIVANLRAEVVELKSAQRDRLAALKDGAPGSAGEKGEKGEKGEPGRDGADGKNGDTGNVGEQGREGPVGPKGDHGSPGESITGPQGPPGESIQGPPGEQGPPGRDGESIVGPRGEKGDPGSSIIGPKGEPGESLAGPQGGRGEKGESIVGPRGEKGDPGESIVGPRGEKGEIGQVGPIGLVPMIKVWRQDEIAYRGELVSHAGSCFQAIKDTAMAPGGKDWQTVAAAGTPGRSLRIRGTYNEEETYAELDVVVADRAWFVAKRDAPKSLPGPDWQAGPSGKRGDKGLHGERGSPGLQGQAGAPAREWVAVKIDRAAYSLTPIMSDGSEGPEISLRELFDQFMNDRGG